MLIRQSSLHRKKSIRDKEWHFIMIKESVLQKDIVILNIYAPNRASKYGKQKLIELQGEIDESTV